ncbi:MAG: hypothetical protein GXP62_08205, partial [Oligoflexia bacterium]|nr:hypothetical protein [Oligoflexia bacterium]
MNRHIIRTDSYRTRAGRTVFLVCAFFVLGACGGAATTPADDTGTATT